LTDFGLHAICKPNGVCHKYEMVISHASSTQLSVLIEIATPFGFGHLHAIWTPFGFGHLHLANGQNHAIGFGHLHLANGQNHAIGFGHLHLANGQNQMASCHKYEMVIDAI